MSGDKRSNALLGIGQGVAAAVPPARDSRKLIARAPCPERGAESLEDQDRLAKHLTGSGVVPGSSTHRPEEEQRTSTFHGCLAVAQGLR